MKNYPDIDGLMNGIRRDYSFGKLEESQAAKNPYAQFVKWFEAALRAKVTGLNTMALATADAQGRPSVRLVLLKAITPQGLVFFSHYDSTKGRQIRQKKWAEIAIFWPEQERQIRISGRVVKISLEESRKYFSRRPRSAQIAAWASHQSRPIESRKLLEKKVSFFEKRFEGKPVPLPPHWGGFRLVPSSYEFWQGRTSRLNDRLYYSKTKNGWKRQRLQP